MSWGRQYMTINQIKQEIKYCPKIKVFFLWNENEDDDKTWPLDANENDLY